MGSSKPEAKIFNNTSLLTEQDLLPPDPPPEALSSDNDDSHLCQTPLTLVSGAECYASSSAPKRTAHALVENEYRANLNDKIVALRDCLPPSYQQRAEEADDEADDEMDDGQVFPEAIPRSTRRRQLNEAVTLKLAREYIAELERERDKLAGNNLALRSRLEMISVKYTEVADVREVCCLDCTRDTPTAKNPLNEEQAPRNQRDE